MRILIAECKQEVSTFNPHRSDYEDFGVRIGEEILRYHRTVRNEIGGALSVFDCEEQVELVPSYSAFFITSGGTLRETAWQRIRGEFLDALRVSQSQGPLDGIYFCMHGAMATDEESDPEGDLLEQARGILGEAIPIVVSLDLHGILTERMLRHSDAVVAYHTYPHVDFFQTGQRAARLLLRVIRKEVSPVTARVSIPALVRGDELITETGAFGKCIRMAVQAESESRALSAGMFIGNPFTDVPELQSTSFVVSDGDATWAGEEAIRIAERFWEHHTSMQVPLLPLHELGATLRSLGEPGSIGTVALIDAADATSSGASGDSNAILKTLLACEYTGRTLIPMVDARAVEAAWNAGIGCEIDVELGGSLDPGRFQPISLRVRVRSMSDGDFRSESFGECWRAGPTAVLESGPMTLVVSSRAVNLYDRSFFYANGQDPKSFDAVVVKSPHCQPHMYAEWCSRLLLIDAPGSSSANLQSLGHTRCPRPIFPLDPVVQWVPHVQWFQRRRDLS